MLPGQKEGECWRACPAQIHTDSKACPPFKKQCDWLCRRAGDQWRGGWW